ncbi:50S ribosomal protein L10 [bacterium HR34]|nr:50S ribosomal protein L10 [bacterium HR34]
MPKTREQKQKVLEQLKENFQKQKIAVFVDFKSTATKDIEALKKDLKKVNAIFTVVKKTLVGLALKYFNIPFDRKKYEGQFGLILGFEDEIEPVKIISKISKKLKKLNILGGIFAGELKEKQEIEALAALPSKKELQGKLIWLLSYPISGFQNVLQGNMRKLVMALSEIQKKKQ